MLANSPRAKSSAAAGIAGLMVLTLVSCTSEEAGFDVRNGLDVPILVTTEEDPEAETEWGQADFASFGVGPGMVRQMTPPMDDPDPPWGWWPFSIFADTQCRDDMYVLAETEDGQRFVHEPPICEDGEWTVSE